MENNKPITLLLDDLRQNIANLINQSNLNLYLVEPIMKDLYEEVQVAAAEQLKQDRIVWETSQVQDQQDEDVPSSPENEVEE